MTKPPGKRAGSSRRSSTTIAQGAGRQLTQRVKTARGRKTSSQRWLQRQLNDPYVAAAQAQGYRSRAAWKLAEMDDRFRLLKPGLRVLDLGAAPGGWTQVAVERCGKRARILAVDINEMDPVPGAAVMQADMRDPDAAARVRAALDGAADLVLSDMAPPATGHRQTDHLRIMALCEAALDLACQVLAPGGTFLCKVLQGGAEEGLLQRMKADFAQVRHAKPPASRSDSSEAYVIAQGFRGEGGTGPGDSDDPQDPDPGRD
ncbi:RlmE family RNA methyltransferase [Marinibaculum pumilum]|uniref:Ribosomal RNA large subunit methyltransferase E n=1 Tax=Marinibaculum pumilum TaxID=1766165 RepID=A0ABV7KZB0_9PROT